VKIKGINSMGLLEIIGRTKSAAKKKKKKNISN